MTFEVPRSLKGKVEVRFKVQCFDGWFGCAGEMIMKKLKEIDQAAYVRFVSVYRSFDDIDSFLKELEIIKTDSQK